MFKLDIGLIICRPLRGEFSHWDVKGDGSEEGDIFDVFDDIFWILSKQFLFLNLTEP